MQSPTPRTFPHPLARRLTSPHRKGDVQMVGALVYKMLSFLEHETGGCAGWAALVGHEMGGCAGWVALVSCTGGARDGWVCWSSEGWFALVGALVNQMQLPGMERGTGVG